MTDEAMIENRTFDEIAVGESASVTRTLSKRDIQLFALVSGDVNPAHLDEDYAESDFFRRVIAHSSSRHAWILRRIQKHSSSFVKWLNGEIWTNSQKNASRKKSKNS